MKVKKLVKRFFLLFFILLALLIGAVFAIPYFFKDELLAAVKEEVNDQLPGATVDFSDVSLSLLKGFPDLRLGVSDLSVIGKGEFQNLPLFRAEEVGLKLDLMSVIRGNEPVAVKSVRLQGPEVHVLVRQDGRANYDIAGEAPIDTTSSTEAEVAYQINLQSYEIVQGKVIYDDCASDVYLEIEDLFHRGSGNFTQDVYDLDTRTEIQGMTVANAGVNYLSGADVMLDAILNANMPEMKFTLKDNELQVNELKLLAQGYVQLLGEESERIKMDLLFEAPENNFKNLLSLIPGAYIEGYEDVQATGNFHLTGGVNGEYNTLTGDLPPFQVQLDVNDGSFRYPDLPLGMENIRVKGEVISPSSDLDQLKVNVPTFALSLGGNPINAAFKLRTPMSDPDLDASVKGKLNLKQLAQAFPMEGIETLAGQITADVDLQARMSTLEREAYEQVNMKGNMQMAGFEYRQAGLPAVQIASADASFSPQYVELREFTAQIGKSDLKASGRIDNLLAYFSPEKTMTGRLTASSSYFDVDEWMPAEEENESPSPTPTGGAPTEEAELFNRFEFDLQATVDKIGYADYDIRDVAVKGNLSPDRLNLQNGSLLIGESDFAADGYISNWWDYVFDGETLGGKINLRSRLLDVNPFMVAEEPAAESSAPEAAYEPVAIPANIAMEINADIGRLIYTDIKLNNLKGQLQIANSEARLVNCQADGLGGRMTIEGGYNTQNPEKPAFDFKYDLSSLNFQETFTAFNTFQQLAPIGKFIEGQFNSTLVMSGELGPDFMPDFNTLSASGYLQTLDGVIKNFKPLSALSNQLKLNLGDAFRLEDTQNWFEVENGRMTVEPFDYTFKDIAMNVSGSHSVAGAGMDYTIQAAVPRERINSNALGSAATSGLDWATGQANQLGLDIEQVDVFNFNIGLSGTLTNPKLSVKLVGADGQTSVVGAAKEQAKEALGSAVDEAKQKVEAEKQALQEKAEQKVDSLKQAAKDEAQRRLDSLKKAAQDEAQKKADELKKKADEQAKSALDSLLNKQKENTKDKVKEKLKKWNPLKKDG